MNNTFIKIIFAFIILCTIRIIIDFVIQDIIIETFIIEGNHYNINLQKIRENKYLVFLLIPLIYFFKIILISLLFVIGLILNQIRFEYAKILLICIIAEYTFLIPLLHDTFYFGLITNNYKELRSFHNFSLLYLFNINDLNNWYRYPLRQLNIFQVFYCFFLGYKFNKIIKITFLNRLRFITYPPDQLHLARLGGVLRE
jgi:hypothetical protein